MTFMQRRKILEVRAHFEKKFDDAFIKIHTTTSTEASSPEYIANALSLAYAQGVLKAVDLILEELDT